MSTPAEKTAYQMFYEMGFKRSTHGTLIIYERKADLIENRVVFHRLNKRYYVQDMICNSDVLRSEVEAGVHKAIHQQLLELGWIK